MFFLFRFRLWSTGPSWSTRGWPRTRTKRRRRRRRPRRRRAARRARSRLTEHRLFSIPLFHLCFSRPLCIEFPRQLRFLGKYMWGAQTLIKPWFSTAFHPSSGLATVCAAFASYAVLSTGRGPELVFLYILTNCLRAFGEQIAGILTTLTMRGYANKAPWPIVLPLLHH